MLRKRSSPLPSSSSTTHQHQHQQQRSKPRTTAAVPPSSSSAFISPRNLLAVCLSPKGAFFPSSMESSTTMSPTSVLDTTSNSSPIGGQFFAFCDKFSGPGKSRVTCGRLGLVDAITDSDKLDAGMVLIGSKLRNKAPCGGAISRSCSIEFGIKNRESQLALLSPGWKSPSFQMERRQSSRAIVMNVDEMEMSSEDYTCVIAHGPNPRKTHIFDNCIVEKCDVRETPRDEGRISNGGDFLSFCHSCKKSIGEGRDIFMYRGESAFCSIECRLQAIQFDEEAAAAE